MRCYVGPLHNEKKTEEGRERAIVRDRKTNAVSDEWRRRKRHLIDAHQLGTQQMSASELMILGCCGCWC